MNRLPRAVITCNSRRGVPCSACSSSSSCGQRFLSSSARDSQRRRLHRRNRQQLLEKEFGGGMGTGASSSSSRSRPAAGGGGGVAKRAATQSSTKTGLGSATSPPPPPPEPPSSFLSNPLLAWYSAKLESHPFTTKCLTSGFIAAGGDLLCQYLVHRNRLASLAEAAALVDATAPSDEDEDDDAIIEIEPIDGGSITTFDVDWHRTGRFGALGFALVAPVVHLWYGTLMVRFPGTSMKAVLKRTSFDQLFFAPIFLPTFMINLMMLEGRPFDEVLPKLGRDLPDALVTNWCLWCPAMLINFRFVPLKYQVLYSNMVGFVWNTYLSWKTQEGEDGGEQEGRSIVRDREVVAE
eukprot:CAMPEP_0178658828 /NCGR_PEP_ID=MMETSP0698-20121128/26208_1 /TAXON_ID=265572 /ORGANISM="Extubocellulus spinifer, Strain CCMP396" /LENGTH=350 /DNA_ID=CAMNT_0020301261 /DNA_START=128 /DNA_END=1177 /DNA_ORIENTATION=+